MGTIKMLGVVAGYSKRHRYFGTPEVKQNLPKKSCNKKILRPKRRTQAIQYIKPIQLTNKTT